MKGQRGKGVPQPHAGPTYYIADQLETITPVWYTSLKTANNTGQVVTD